MLTSHGLQMLEGAPSKYHKGLSTCDHLVTITEIRPGLAMELNLHIGEEIQIPGCRNTSAALESVRRLSRNNLPGAVGKGSG